MRLYVTCGERMVDGQPYKGRVTGVMLAYLVLEGQQDINELAEVFFALKDEPRNNIQKNLDNMKKQLAELGCENCIVQSGAQVLTRHLDTDLQRLIGACQRRDFEAIETTYHNGKFLAGLEKHVSKRAGTWIQRWEDRRVFWIWDAYLHLIAAGRLAFHKLEDAYRIANAVPDRRDIRFIYLYDLLSQHALLTGGVAKAMQAEVMTNGEGRTHSLDAFVEELRESLKQSDQWREPLELWKDVLTEKTPEMTSDKDPVIEPEVKARAALETGQEHLVKRYRWKWLAGAGLSLLVLWLLLLPLSSLLNDRGAALVQAEAYSQALRYLRPAQVMNQLGLRRASVPYNLASGLESLGRFDEAAVYYEQSLSYDSNFFPAYNNLSRLLIDKQDTPAEALTFLNRAYERVAGKPAWAQVEATILKNRAWARYELGHDEAARRDLDQALSIVPTMASLHCLGAMLTESSGGAAALPSWEKCVAYDVAGQWVEPAWRSLAQERLASR